MPPEKLALKTVLETLGAELRRSAEALKALPANSREALTAQQVEERLAREADPNMRERVTAAIVHYSHHLNWPLLSQVEASFVYERLNEAVAFGRWLLAKAVPDQPRFDQVWMEWLLIEYWNYAGRARWRDRLTSLVGDDLPQ